MTQPQAHQITRYEQQFKLFSELVLEIHPNYSGVAWGIAHRDGLDEAIAFCENKIQDSSLMQACRDAG
jgi:hypothetical protein